VTTATYLYDADARRVAKTLQSTTTTQFLLDGWCEIEVRSSADNYVVPRRQFVFGASSMSAGNERQHDPTPDTTCIGVGDEHYFYHQNQIYSVIALTRWQAIWSKYMNMILTVDIRPSQVQDQMESGLLVTTSEASRRYRHAIIHSHLPGETTIKK
jgi:hypothetical protein